MENSGGGGGGGCSGQSSTVIRFEVKDKSHSHVWKKRQISTKEIASDLTADILIFLLKNLLLTHKIFLSAS